jgi:hypothetical protein
MEESLNLKSILIMYGRKHLIRYKNLLLLSIRNSFLLFNFLRSIENLKINIKDGRFIILRNNLAEWELSY